VGCGAAARLHLSALEGAARSVVTAAVDINQTSAEAIATRTGAQVFTSFEDALASETFEAVLVLLPHHLHEDAAIAAFNAGQHVLLEKPMASTLDACARILDAASRVERVFMVAENAQYWPEVTLAKQLLDDGAIGDVVTARAWHCLPPMAEFLEGDDPWRLVRAHAGGGVAIDAGSHWLLPLRRWLGELVDVVAITGRPYPAMEGESMVRALCRFETEVIASFDIVLPPGPGVAPVPVFQITGTTGEIVVELGGRVMVYDGSDPGGIVAGHGSYLQSFIDQLAAFEAAVLDGVQPVAAAEYAVGELRGALAMYRSAETRQWEPVW